MFKFNSESELEFSESKFCFSSASILRCQDGYRFGKQVEARVGARVLIFPLALELIFATSVVFAKWGDGSRKHLLLTVEGWTHFLLALLEVLLVGLPAARESLTVFKTIDTVIAAASFLPILFYLSYLWLFTCGEILDTLPLRYQVIPKYILLSFVPVIVILHEITSFIGLYHFKFYPCSGPLDPCPKFSAKPPSSKKHPDHPYFLRVGFTSQGNYTIWTSLNSLTLALLTSYQAIAFFITFYRLIKAAVNQRKIENKAMDQSHLIKGMGWISGGLKLGALETAVGFPEISFGVIMTRRVLRLLSRAFLIIGIVKGIDAVEDFRLLGTKESPKHRESNVQKLIDRSSLSTTRQLTSSEIAFYHSPHASTILSPEIMQESGIQDVTLTRKVDYKGRPIVYSSADSSFSRPRDVRVTIQKEPGSAPSLNLRLSGLELPSPADIVESVKSRSESEWYVPRLQRSSTVSEYTISNSSYYAPGMIRSPQAIVAPSPSADSTDGELKSSFSSDSISDSRTQVAAITSYSNTGEFRAIADHSHGEGVSRGSVVSDSSAAASASTFGPTSKQKPSPLSIPSPSTSNKTVEAYNHDRQGGSPASVASYPYTIPAILINDPLSTSKSKSRTYLPHKNVEESYEAQTVTNPFEDEGDDLPSALPTAASRDIQWGNDLPSVASLTALQGTRFEGDREGMWRGGIREAEESRSRMGSRTTPEVSWMSKGERGHDGDARLNAAWRGQTGIARVGTLKAPEKNTPSLSHVRGDGERASMAIDGIVMPSRHASHMKFANVSSVGKGSRDLDVLMSDDSSTYSQEKSFIDF